MNIDFCLQGFCTVCEVNFPKRRREIHLAHSAKTLKPKKTHTKKLSCVDGICLYIVIAIRNGFLGLSADRWEIMLRQIRRWKCCDEKEEEKSSAPHNGPIIPYSIKTTTDQDTQSFWDRKSLSATNNLSGPTYSLETLNSGLTLYPKWMTSGKSGSQGLRLQDSHTKKSNSSFPPSMPQCSNKSNVQIHSQTPT